MSVWFRTVELRLVHYLHTYLQFHPDEIKNIYSSGSFYIIKTIILGTVVKSDNSLFSICLVPADSPKHVTVQARPGLEVKENVMLTLSCSAESNPPVRSVTWRKTTDGREEIIQQTRTFRVNSVSPSDSGLYSCEATNDIGSVKSQRAEVKVRCE